MLIDLITPIMIVLFQNSYFFEIYFECKMIALILYPKKNVLKRNQEIEYIIKMKNKYIIIIIFIRIIKIVFILKIHIHYFYSRLVFFLKTVGIFSKKESVFSGSEMIFF